MGITRDLAKVIMRIKILKKITKKTIQTSIIRKTLINQTEIVEKKVSQKRNEKLSFPSLLIR